MELLNCGTPAGQGLLGRERVKSKEGVEEKGVEEKE